MVGKNLEYLPKMISFEKEHPLIMMENYTQEIISYNLEFLWICESHLKKFESEKRFSDKKITQYQNRIHELKNKIKDITVCESLQR